MIVQHIECDKCGVQVHDSTIRRITISVVDPNSDYDNARRADLCAECTKLVKWDTTTWAHQPEYA